MNEKMQEVLPDGWKLVTLKEVCLPVSNKDPRKTPDIQITYIDISSIDNATKCIVDPKILLGKDAPSRAKQVVKEGDIIVSTTRPNLNAVACIPYELDGQICSTGFSVLRPNPTLIDSDYLFGFVRSEGFVTALSDLVRGALYPAVTDKQVYAQLIPLAPLEEQKLISERLNAQLYNLSEARSAAEAQLETLRILPAALLRAAFSPSLTKESNVTPPPPTRNNTIIARYPVAYRGTGRRMHHQSAPQHHCRSRRRCADYVRADAGRG